MIADDKTNHRFAVRVKVLCENIKKVVIKSEHKYLYYLDISLAELRKNHTYFIHKIYALVQKY